MESETRQGKKVKLEDRFGEQIDDHKLKLKEEIEPNNNTHDSSVELQDSRELMKMEHENDYHDDRDSQNDTKMPEVFQTDHLSMNERWDVIFSEILPDRKPFEVEQGFYYYVEENVQDGGWQAVWRSHQLMCDVLVEVIDLEAEQQRAKVEIVTPFCCESNTGKSVTQKEVETALDSNKEKASLLELFPVFEESGELDNTAMALEHLRFFYDYIWRLSDENDDGDYVYAQRHLEQRMKMYYDVKNKNVSVSIAEQYNETMTEYQQKYWQLKLKRAQYDPDSEVDDGEGPEIPEEDMAGMTELCEDLDALMKTLDKLEDPVMRAIVMRGSANKRDKKKRSSEDRHSRPNQEVITHLVAETLTMGMIKILDLDENTIIMQHSSVQSALESCYNGDTVLLFPGRYSGEGFYNLSLSIDIKGVGKTASDVVVLCQEQVSIFVDCTAYKLSISNMTFESEAQESPSFAALDVRSGTTTLNNCIFRSLWQPIMVSKEGTLFIDQCQIHGFVSPGVRVSAGGTVSMTKSHLHHCGSQPNPGNNTTLQNCGFLIEADEGAEGLDKTTINLHGNRIEDTGGPGIWIQIHSANPEAATKSCNVATDEELENVLPACIKWQGRENVFANNKVAAIYVEYVTCTR